MALAVRTIERTKGVAVRAFLPLLILALCAFVGLGSALAQAPILPTPPPTVIVPPLAGPPLPGSGTICGTPTQAGGQTVSPILPVRASFQFALPPGNFAIGGGIADPGGEFVRVCYVEGNSAIFFNPQGSETGRVVNSPSANAVLDEIVRGIKVGPPQTPPFVAPPMNICGSAARSVRAGERINLNSPQGAVTITLPATGAYQFSIPGEIAGSGQGISICDVTTGSTVLLNWETGRELGRVVSGPQGGPALDRIVAGVHFMPAGSPQLAPAPFRPPDTGGAGLLGAAAALP